MVFWIGVKKPTKAAGITPTTTTFRKNKKVSVLSNIFLILFL